MKKLLFASLALLGSVALVNAQEATPAPAPAPQEESNQAVTPEPAAPAQEAPAQDQQDDKTKIKSEELPDAVKKALEAQEYRGWLIDAAYHVKSTDSYEVQLKNGAETKTVTFDKEGKAQG